MCIFVTFYLLLSIFFLNYVSYSIYERFFLEKWGYFKDPFFKLSFFYLYSVCFCKKWLDFSVFIHAQNKGVSYETVLTSFC